MSDGDDWDAEEFPLPARGISREPFKARWDDEDKEEEEEDVKESWEDDDTPKPAVVPVAALEPIQLSTASAVTALQKAKIGGKDIRESREKKTIDEDDLTEKIIDRDDPATKLAEKLRQQRLVEEADFRFTTELFGKRIGDKTLDTFIPKSESDFLEYAELVAHKLLRFEKSFHYLTLLKAVIRHSMASLMAADAKEVASSVQVIFNEKLRAEKEANIGKKKIGSKKKQLHIEADEEGYTGVLDNDDAYDFM